nr:5'-nucleotidase C-terminal domain-containing protein [Puerhibacterium puerhi]
MNHSSPWRRGRAAAAAALSATLAVPAAAALAAPAAPAAAAADPVQIDIVDINDFHGRIQAAAEAGDPSTVGFAGTVEEIRAQNPDGTVFVSAGDNIGASLFASSFEQDQPTIDVLNALGLQASAVGNHEFDQGYDDLTGRVADAADWPYLGANVYRDGTDEPALDEYAIVPVQGVDVAFVGVVTQETPTLVSPAGVAALDFGDPVAALNRVTAQLQDGDDANGEADVVVALVHDGASAGTPDGATLEDEVAAGGVFADIVTQSDPRVAAILTGHTHKQYVWDAPVPGAEGQTRPIVQTGSYGENVGHVTLSLDPETHEVLAYEAENVAQTSTSEAELVATYPRVAEVDRIVTAALERADEVGKQPVAEVTADITTAFAGGSYVDGRWTGGTRDDRASESALGNLVADALRDSLADPARGGAEIGIANPGGLRAELLHGEDGVITYAEANAVLPFVNNLWSLTLTGAQLEEVLEQQWQTDGEGERPSRPYLALGLSDNVTWVARTADGNATPGDNVAAVYVDGELVQPDDTFRVATFSFLATGGDNFRAFADGTDVRDSGLVDRDAWIAYLSGNAPVSPSFARTRTVAPQLPAAVPAGEKLAATLSGLDLTSLGAPQNTAAALSLVPADRPDAEGVDLGEVPVVDGTADVAAVVPADTAPGEYTLRAAVAPSGTVAQLPVTVEAASEAPTPTDPSPQPTTEPTPGAGDEPGDPAPAGPQLALDAQTVAQGGSLTVSGAGFAAGETVAVELHSAPVLLAEGTVAEDGTFTARVTVPADAAVGEHTVVATADSGTASAALTVTAAAAAGPDVLPQTGAQVAGIVLLALALVGAGTWLVVRRRRLAA